MTNDGSSKSPGLGKRGEFLVGIQALLMLGFVLLPVWHPGLPTDWLLTSQGWRIGIGMALAIIALVLAGLGSHHIRDYLTPLPYPVDHSQLVQHGVYGLVRHPLYSSLLTAGLAWAVYNLSLSHLLALGVCFVFFNYKANREEAWLTERHPEYRDYAARVAKFIPGVF